MARVKPKTQRETLDQVWYAVVGTNGDGLIDRVKRLEERPRDPALEEKDRRAKWQTRVSTVVGITVLIAFGASLLGVQLKGGVKRVLRDWLDQPAVVEVVQ